MRIKTPQMNRKFEEVLVKNQKQVLLFFNQFK